MIEYRRKLTMNSWHFCPNCSDWPEDNYEAEIEVPSQGALCGECKIRRANQTLNINRETITRNETEVHRLGTGT